MPFVPGRRDEARLTLLKGLTLTRGTTLQALRYKDYHLARPPAPLSVSRALQAQASTSKSSSTAHKHDARNDTAKKLAATAEDTPGYEEVDSVANFAEAIERRGVLRWWRVAMGYEGGGDVIG